VLLVVLVPMLGLQFLAWRDLRGERAEAAAATEVKGLTELQHSAANLIVPMSKELTVTNSLVIMRNKGYDLPTLEAATGIDYLQVRDDAIAKVDRCLEELRQMGDGVVLSDGTDVGATAADLRAEIDDLRTQFTSAPDTLSGAVVGSMATDMVDDLSVLLAAISHDVRWSAGSSELISISAATDQMVAALEHGSLSLWYAASSSVSGDPQDALMRMVEQNGAFDASLLQLKQLVDPDRAITVDELRGKGSFTAVSATQSQFITAVSGAALAGPPSLVTEPTDIRLVSSHLGASEARLDDTQEFAHGFFAQEVALAQTLRDDADTAKTIALAVMIVTLVVSLLLLVLLMRSILRPLGRLMRQSRRVQQGDLHLPPVKPSGPTDLRVVTRAFNDMVSTLQAYESQLDRLARGETKVDQPLPGPLGDTVRRSVSQLATVTAQLHASEAAANVQARTDALTGLSNRTAALEHLAIIAMQARQNDEPGAIIFLDLDGFKSVNDTQGHAEGDRILAEISDRVRDACPNDVVARIGGDEFLVLIERAESLAAVTAKAHGLIEVMSLPCTGSKGQLFTLSASAGVSMIDGHRDPLTCIAQADTAVYHAKERGRGRVEAFDERLSEAIEERAEMALTMRQGLAERQFSLRLQPIIDVATSHPIGAEVLLRWHRPGIGEIGPAEFIPIAERTGVIVDLETWVLEQSVAILRDWRIDPVTAGMRLAVNISGRHIVEGNLAPLLDELCRRAKVDPGLIDLEITETHLMADVYRSIVVVDDLRAQGVNVAIDDFGTGYSSMSYLHRLTVDALKIDQIFVNGMVDDRLDRTIVELLLRLGDSMGLKVVAEGVDTEQKLLLLRELGCHWAQGFHIARPMAIDDATRWLKQQQALASSMA
jgi:diguanylate cyclase (GGDEF)-like protein